jgi:hypothetical protein
MAFSVPPITAIARQTVYLHPMMPPVTMAWKPPLISVDQMVVPTVASPMTAQTTMSVPLIHVMLWELATTSPQIPFVMTEMPVQMMFVTLFKAVRNSQMTSCV